LMIFEGVNRDRKIKVKGELIQIFDPEKDGDVYWEYANKEEFGYSQVPRNHKVRVVMATIYWE